MSDYLAKRAHFFECPYDRAHQITRDEVNSHLLVCRQVYLDTLKAKGKQVKLKVCSFNPDHQVPAVELKFHESLCKVDSKPVSNELGQANSGQAKESAGAAGKVNAKPAGKDVRDSWFAIHLEDFGGLGSADDEEQGAAGQVENWYEDWEEKWVGYQDGDRKEGKDLSNKDLEQIYAELEKVNIEGEDKFADNDDYPGNDPWVKIQDSE